MTKFFFDPEKELLDYLEQNSIVKKSDLSEEDLKELARAIHGDVLAGNIHMKNRFGSKPFPTRIPLQERQFKLEKASPFPTFSKSHDIRTRRSPQGSAFLL